METTSAPCKIEVGEKGASEISPLLFGYNVLYCIETAERWADGFVPESLRQAGATILRYPGGHVASFYHWKMPYYSFGQDGLDPAIQEQFDAEQLKKENAGHMDLDCYLDWCRKLNVEPMLGINLLSGHRFNRLQEGIDEAIEMLAHCQEQGTRIKYAFLDNEVGHRPADQHVPAEKYPEYVQLYSKALKQFDPDIQLICNYIGPVLSDNVKQLIREAGHDFAIYDYHWYYGTDGWGWFDREKWLADDFSKQAGEFDAFYRFCEETGNTHLKLALLEWNLGPSLHGEKSAAIDQALVMSDMMMLFIKKNVHSACVWPLQWISNVDSNVWRNTVDSRTRQRNAGWQMMHLFKDLCGQIQVPVQTDDKSVVAVAATSAEEDMLVVYLLNKTQQDGREAEIQLNDRRFKWAKADMLVEKDFDTVEVKPANAATNNGNIQLRLQPLSVTRVCISLDTSA